MRPSTNSARRLVAAGASALALTFAAPVASAQLPGGISVEDARAAVSAPISVPAGETVTVDIGVPVSASYSGGGWSVSSAGTSVTVTAPAEPGAQASVPVSAAGQAASITLVATGDAAGPAPTPAPAPAPAPTPVQPDGAPSGADARPGAPERGSGPDDGVQEKDAGADETGAGARTAPDREAAPAVDGSGAEYVDLPATVDGQSIVATMGIGQAANLYRQFRDVDEDSVSLRYLDVDGQIIEGVKRDIDVASRTLTLTYPEGQTPDNPFILQVVRGGESVLVVRLIDEERPVAQPRQEGAGPEEFSRPMESETTAMGVGFPVLWLAIGIIAVVIAVAALAFVRRRKRRP